MIRADHRRARGAPLSRYGYFDAAGTEFVVTEPNTPRPWINYLTNERYCAIISQCAGGYSFYKDCRANRITRWSPEGWHFDRPGRYLYVKEGKSLWSATYQPIRVSPERFEARHGLGYTTIETRYRGVDFSSTYFVPVEDPCEVWLFSVTNRTSHTRSLELFPYVEWLLGDYHLELRYRNIMNLYNRVWWDQRLKAILAKKTAAWGDLNIQPFTSQAFFASSLPVAGCVTIKDAFLGRANTEERPEMLRKGPFTTVPLCSGEDGIAVFRHRLTLKPKRSVTFSVVMGQAEPEDVARLVKRYRQVKESQQALKRVETLWRTRILDTLRVETPDRAFDQIMNVWGKYQLYICNFWSRSPSYYHEGSGGRGYRDSCQDAEGIMSINPERAKQTLLRVATLIRKDGTSAPGWSDTSGPAGHRPNKDHPVWLTRTVAAYMKETGDKDILKARLPYLKDRWIRGWEIDPQYQGGPTTDGAGSLFDHLWRNLDFTYHDVGERGMPLIGHGDWNDAIDAAGTRLRGESIWLAQALVHSQKILAELARLIGEEEKAQELLKRAQTMTDRVNRYGWDGEWYICGVTDDGTIYGSHANTEGKIFLNTQSWPLLADMASPEQREKALASVEKYLDGPHGLALFYPAYSTWNPKLGRISMFSQGTKENAAVFCHAATFMIVAELMHGRGTRAYRHLKAIMPNAQADYDLYKTEPYAYAEYLVGPENPYRYGEGAFTWITGTASWTFMAGTEWLLGARRDYDGLRIDPCIPKHWKRCRIVRPFRGAIYDIEIHNPHGLEKGTVALEVDGRSVTGNLIRPHRDGKTHRVRVVLERPSPASTPRQRTSFQYVSV
jgi:cellobiose phosphorylase